MYVVLQVRRRNTARILGEVWIQTSRGDGQVRFDEHLSDRVGVVHREGCDRV